SLKNYHMKPGFNFPSDQFQRELMRPATIGQKFTAFEVEEKLRKAFYEQGLRNVNFDFAVIADVGAFSYEYQLRSDNFLKAFEDTVNNFQWVLPLQPPSGSDLENLTPA